jgi:hypothetical protein
MPDHSQLLIDFHHFDGTDHGGLTREDYLSHGDRALAKLTAEERDALATVGLP